MTDREKIASIIQRRAYFDAYFPPIERCDARQDISLNLSNSCPSCGYLTLNSRCNWEICAFCHWEDDGQDNLDADLVCGGPNGEDSLTEYRLRIFDLMEQLKKAEDSRAGQFVGADLVMLDNLIERREDSRQRVLGLLEQLFLKFDLMRQIDDGIKPQWRFLTLEQQAKLKPRHG